MAGGPHPAATAIALFLSRCARKHLPRTGRRVAAERRSSRSTRPCSGRRTASALESIHLRRYAAPRDRLSGCPLSAQLALAILPVGVANNAATISLYFVALLGSYL